jgi:hypothetical protein
MVFFQLLLDLLQVRKIAGVAYAGRLAWFGEWGLFSVNVSADAASPNHGVPPLILEDEISFLACRRNSYPRSFYKGPM